MSQRLVSELTLKLNQQVSGPAAEARKALASVDQALAAISKRREADQRLAALVKASEQARARVRDLANQLMATETPTKRLMRAYEAATQAADKMAKRVEAQKSAMARAEQGVRSLIGPTESLAYAEQRLARDAEMSGRALIKAAADGARSARMRKSLATEIARAAAEQAEANVRAAKKEADANLKVARSYHERRAAAIAVMGGGAMWVGSKAGEVARDTIGRGLTLDQAQRQQVAFGNISEEAQKTVLRPQADRIAQSTRFSIPDVLSGQTNILESLPSNFEGDIRAQIAQAITANAVNYALAIPGNIDMSEAGHRIISYLKTMNKDISTPEKAASESARAVNMMIKAAKLSGAKDNDISEFMRFGGAPGTFAGFSDPFKFAILAAQKRAGSDGALTGTFLRALAGYSVAPTKKGLAALADIGIRYDDYTTMKGGATAENFARGLSQRFGVKLSPDQMARIQAALEGTYTDESGAEVPILSDRERFTEAVQPIVEESFARGKGGKVRATDSAKVKKDIDAYYNNSIGAVNVEQLFRDIIKKDPSMGVLNAFLGKEQGGRFIALLQQMKYFEHDIDALQSVPDDFAKKIGEYLMGGVYGSQQNAQGSFETAMTRISEAWSSKLQWAFDRMGEAGDAVSGMSENARFAAGALLALGGAAVFIGGASALFKGGAALLGGGVAGAAVGATAGAGSGSLVGGAAAGIAARVVPPIAAGAAVGWGLSTFDPEKNMWGLTSPLDRWMREHFGFDLTMTPGEVWEIWKKSAAPGVQDPSHESPSTPPVAPAFSAPPAAPEGQKSGEDLGSGMADGLERQSSLIEEQARKILAAVQDVMRIGVDLPVRLDASGLAAQTESVRASVRRQANSEVAAMLRATYADTERG